MLTFFGTPRRLCDGLRRRDFLTLGGLGIGGLTLADLLRAQAQAPRPGQTQKSVIMIYLNGGPSHIDTYDMKPKAPVEYRGEFQPIQTNVPGMDICELMPQQAKIADKLALIRNLRFLSNKDLHLPDELITGYPNFAEFGGDRDGRPAFGSVVSKLAGGHQSMPPYVVLNWNKGNFKLLSQTAYLSQAHWPFEPKGPELDNLGLHPEVSRQRLEDRRALQRAFEGVRRDLDEAADGMDTLNAKALAMISTPRVREAFDLSREPAALKQKYGGGNACLLARRLVEAGVPVVTLTMAGGYQDWDTHDANFATLRRIVPAFDQSIAALVTDLHERGLDKQVAVVVWGEMGRTPRINNLQGGRDHWSQAGFALLAGGGFRTGQVIGATTQRAERPDGDSYIPQNILATLYRHLGIDPGTTLPDRTGRPLPLLDSSPVVELT